MADTHRNQLPNLCGGCHGQEGLLTDQLVRLPQSYQQYANSVHGLGIEEGVPPAAACTDCHRIHDLRGATDPASAINPLNVASTCGRCHGAVREEYDRSIHGRALQAGVTDSPTCTDCHGAHLILSSSNPDAPTCGARLARDTCGKCHDDPVIISKYGLQDGVVGSYLESYHGWASRSGCQVVASCSDCHTAHRVLPAEDSASSISPGQVVETCGRCHEGATEAFANSYNHRTASMSGNPVNRVIRAIYLWAILLIVGGMVIHNLVIMNFFMIRRRREEGAPGETVTRFSRNQLVQHLLLTVSFLLLVVTGFALRYPEAWWVEWLTRAGMTEGLRGDLHRAGAVMLLFTSLYHGYYLLATRGGRRELRALLPTRKDWNDLWSNLRYHTFRSTKKVEFGRYDYTQKAEYWALVWGTILMALTGLVLWFPTVAARLLPPVVIPASQTIHFYEAVLAVLVILVWHFFFVVFHPEEYPMSWTWITGRMSRKAAKEHHGEWYRKEFSKVGGVHTTGEKENSSEDRGQRR
jgi:formate dehydrogenase gamma subunit